MADGWSRGYTPKALRQAGIFHADLERLVQRGMARKSRYHRRRWHVMTPSLTPESVAELRAALSAMERLSDQASTIVVGDPYGLQPGGILEIGNESVEIVSVKNSTLTVQRR